MEASTGLAASRVTTGIIGRLMPVIRGVYRQARGRGVVMDCSQLPCDGVWEIGLRYPLSEGDLAGVPGGSVSDQGDWLLNNKSGVLFGLRGDRFHVYNALRKEIEVESLRVEVVSRTKSMYFTEVQSPDAGSRIEDVWAADLREGGDPIVREARFEDGAMDWKGKPFGRRPVRIAVAPKESLSFQLFTETGLDTVRWRLVMSYVARNDAGKKGALREVRCPARNEAPLVTANQSEQGAKEYWLTGVEGLQGWPYFQRARQTDVGLLGEDCPWV